MTEIIPYLFYRDVPAALDWLARCFGFTEAMRHKTESGIHAEMSLDGQRIMMGQGAHSTAMAPPEEGRPVTSGIFVYVPDVVAHYARAAAAGVRIDQGLGDHGYGETYTARDLDGQIWFFTQAPGAENATS